MEQTRDVFFPPDGVDLRSELAQRILRGISRFPRAFDQRLYKGLERLIGNAADDFLETRSFDHLRKILLVQFFLQTRMEAALRENGDQKFLFLKLFSKNSRIGFGMALTSSYGFQYGFQQGQAIQAFHSLLPGIQEIPGSFYLWQHPGLPYLFCYGEVAKIRGKELQSRDLKELEEALQEQLLLIPPPTPGLFWPYNKEDAYRQIQILQREIKRREDLPHVSVHFREQTSSFLEFLIYLVRPRSTEPLDYVFKYLPESLHFFCRFSYENKTPVPIQAGVFSVKVPSRAFEVCGTINLLYARRYLIKFIETAMGPFRDYNGGLFEMQQQHFEAIRMRLGDQIPYFDLFAEKVFYALHPVETWLSLSLKEAENLFRSFSELIEEKKPFAVRSHSGFTIIKTGNNADLLKLRRLSAEASENDSHAHLTFGDFHYLCLLGPPQNERLRSILKGFSNEKSNRFHLVLQEGIPPSLNPHYSSGDMRCRILNKLLFEGLTRLDAKGEPRLGAAIKMAVSKEGLLYTFKLRPFCWSNGEKVTASDYAASWQSALSDPVSHPELLYNIKNARKFKERKISARELGVRAMDAETLEVELEWPDPSFLSQLAQPYFFPLFGSLREPKWFNGPYLVREENKEGILLERNPYFWDPKRSGFEQIQIRWANDIELIYSQFLQGKVDWIGDPLSILSPAQIKQLEFEGRLLKWEAPRRFQLHFNTNHPILSSPSIRKALSLSLDPNHICDRLFPCSVPLNGQLAQSGPFRAESSELFVKREKELFAPFRSGESPPLREEFFKPLQPDRAAAAHYFETGLEKLGLTRETFPRLTFSYSLQTRRKELASYMQSAWAQSLGIDIQLDGNEWNGFRSKLEKKDFEICGTIVGTLGEKSAGFLRQWEGASSWNFSGWSHSGYREKIDRGSMDEAKQILEDECPFFPLFNYTHLYAHTPGLEGFSFDSEGCVDFSSARKI